MFVIPKIHEVKIKNIKDYDAKINYVLEQMKDVQDAEAIVAWEKKLKSVKHSKSTAKSYKKRRGNNNKKCYEQFLNIAYFIEDEDYVNKKLLDMKDTTAEKSYKCACFDELAMLSNIKAKDE